MLKYGLNELDYSALINQSRGLDFSVCNRKIRLAVLADCAPQYLVSILKTLFQKNQLHAEIYEADFDTIESEIYNSDSGLYQFGPDYIVIIQSTAQLRSRYYAAADKDHFVDQEITRISRLWDTLQEKTKAQIIHSNFVTAYERAFGNYDLKTSSSFFYSVERLNGRLVEFSKERPKVVLNDLNYLASYVGIKNWQDEKMWILAKALCAFEYLPLVAQNIVDLVLARLGFGVKCVVFDLDNTIWGGVIGDDGLEGIQLGHQEDGEAYTHVQHFLLSLKRRGILLAVCSKNDFDVAIRVFREHPEMVLNESDIAAFAVNWENKAENLVQIKEQLNIGFDSIVFLDDNPFERNLIRQMCPEVIVPELPEDPADYVKALSELNLFETGNFSAADAGRSELYQMEAIRKQEEKKFSNLNNYLESLEMKAVISRFDEFHLPRIAQLIQRSNQFNLMTKRFSEADCEQMMRDSAHYFPIYVRLRDRYGDHGLISVVVLSLKEEDLYIEEWLMSCRVLARGVEQHVMNFIFDWAKKGGFKRITGAYLPTQKNGMVKNFYSNFGFEKRSEDSAVTAWSLPVGHYRERKTFIQTEYPITNLRGSEEVKKESATHGRDQEPVERFVS